MKKIIIDTDIGDDIDDALALAIAFALNSPELDILGITTVSKNTHLRTLMALELLEVYNRRNIPVAKVIGMPLINWVDCSEIPCQYEVTPRTGFL